MEVATSTCLSEQQQASPLPPTSAIDRNPSSDMPAADRPRRSNRPAQPKSVDFAPLPKTNGVRPAAKSTTGSSIKGSWSSNKILTPSSAVISPSIVLQAFLITCISGFDTYTEDEKRSIIDCLPPSYRKYELDAQGKLICPIAIDFIMRDPFLKRSVSKFKTDVEDGYYDPSWQSKARKAMQERREGQFDEYLKQHVEETFGGTASHDQGKEAQNQVAGGQTSNGQDETGSSTDDGEWVANKAKKGKRGVVD